MGKNVSAAQLTSSRIASGDEEPDEKQKIHMINIVQGNNIRKIVLTTHPDKKNNVTNLLNKINKRSSIRRFEIVEPSLHDIFIKTIQNSEQA